jgi:hypothetical protein
VCVELDWIYVDDEDDGFWEDALRATARHVPAGPLGVRLPDSEDDNGRGVPGRCLDSPGGSAVPLQRA